MKFTYICKIILLSVVVVQVSSCKTKVKTIKKRSSGYLEKQVTISLEKNEYKNIYIEGVAASRVTIKSDVEGKDITLVSNIVADTEKTYQQFVKRSQFSSTGSEDMTIFVSDIGYFNCSIFDNPKPVIEEFAGTCIRNVVITIPKETKANIFLNKQLIAGEITFSMLTYLVSKQSTVFDQKKLIKGYVENNGRKGRFMTVREVEELFHSLGGPIIVEQIAEIVSGYIIDTENITDYTLRFASDYLREDVRIFLSK